MKAALYRLKSLEPYLPPKYPSTFDETLNRSHLYIISKSRTVTIANNHFQKLPLFAIFQDGWTEDKEYQPPSRLHKKSVPPVSTHLKQTKNT